MRVSLLAVLLLIALAAAGALVWLRGDSRAAPGASPAAPQSTRRAQDAPDAFAPTSAAPANATARREAAPEQERVATAIPPPPEIQGIEDGGLVPVGVDFTSKYRDVAREKLLDKLMRLEGEVERTSTKLFAERFAANRFTTEPIAANDARNLDEIVESLTSESVLCSTRLVMIDTPRPEAVQIVSLRRAEFPGLYALVDERDWLRDSLARTAPTDK